MAGEFGYYSRLGIRSKGHAVRMLWQQWIDQWSEKMDLLVRAKCYASMMPCIGYLFLNLISSYKDHCAIPNLRQTNMPCHRERESKTISETKVKVICLSPSLGSVEIQLEVMGDCRSKVALRIRRMTTSLSSNLVFGLHKLLLDPGTTLLVRAYRLGVKELGQRCDDLLVDLGKLV